MSRWHTEFEQHPFQSFWKDLQTEAPLLQADDLTIQTSVDEIDRLKRVIAYLTPLIANVDAELTPKSIWDNFQAQAEPCLAQVRSFVSNRNIGHIQGANAHADNLLSYVRPFMVLPVKVLEAVSAAATEYRLQVEHAAAKIVETSKSTVKTVQSDLDAISELQRSALSSHSQIEDLRVSLFVGSSDKPATKLQIDELTLTVKTQADGVQVYHDKLLIDGSVPAIKSEIDAAAKAILAGREKVERDLKLEEHTLGELDAFYDKIFGPTNTDGTRGGGLKLELDERTRQLVQLENDQIVKHKAMFDQIETLLPGATSAGLSTAYNKLRLSFDNPIAVNTKVFFIAVGLMPVLAVLACIQSFTLSPLELQFIEVPTYEAILRHMLAKAPFILPLIWLAIFAMRRRSQYERLQQEYAHKEALAASYESYKTQIAQLQVPDIDSLKKELISKAIEAIAFNVSTTLSEAPTEKMPLEHALATLNGDKGLMSLLGKLKDVIPKKD
ncbi:hypothetical protein [Rhodoferax aquaticus]|uniref:Uncharacterized protein n=1 Tax=Rhodoferax aquaticus TaxID=2527691 RepID=A0A515EN04_9BURK|nr:hypothetical protein [Rhodoferax aquaticus]QDL54057.1 hypothetical protein EXZ61_07675 [Rhodoferax aquaticus]